MILGRSNRLATLAMGLLAAACGGGGAGTQPPGPPVDLVIIPDGDHQNWYFDNPLPTALSVKAIDVHGQAVPGVTVMWAVASGSGAVSPTQSTTNSSGVASTTDSIGSSTNQTVSATFTGLASPASFTEFATTPPTTGSVSLMSLAFSPKNVVVQTGGTVTWTWNDNPTAHNVTFASGPTPLPANSPTQATGTYPVTFTTVGTYGYHCTIHAGMDGTVSVVH